MNTSDDELKSSLKVPCILHLDSIKGSQSVLEKCIKWSSCIPLHSESRRVNSDFSSSISFMINCGFNCVVAALELYREQAHSSSILREKLLLGACVKLNLLRKNTSNDLKWKEVCGKEGILSLILKARVEIECVRREFLCTTSKALKMDASFDSTNERNPALTRSLASIE
ncbi:lysine-specific demethylase JMJ16 [Artemisia annua]|uniref:Lysine-specific demethylase JMJ16 n=1 Tax=Artemisia annua TaxID=35608 RepID=A0A2U1LHW9_ARTAN|nr:lysine-specific demethylase JMJ16 [Artemisia annua]